MTKVLSKTELLSGQLLRRELVYIKDWDASVWLRELSGEAVRAYKREIKKYQSAGATDVPDDEAGELITSLLADSICDEGGNLLFTKEEAKGLMCNSLNTLTDILNKAFAVSGVRQNIDGDVSSEVADNPPNPTTSLSESSPSNSDEQGEKS